MGILLASPAAACDFCLRLPRVPFELDRPAAIEVALATQAAAGQGQIELNPDVTLTTLAGDLKTAPLDEFTPQQLIAHWVRTRPAANARSLRCSLEIVFVDVDYAGLVDIRFGEILPGNPSDGPAEVRLTTTKAGFCRLLADGLTACEQQQLAALEAERPVQTNELQRLFATSSPFVPLASVPSRRAAANPLAD